jgi:hypothetical protein
MQSVDVLVKQIETTGVVLHRYGPEHGYILEGLLKAFQLAKSYHKTLPRMVNITSQIPGGSSEDYAAWLPIGGGIRGILFINPTVSWDDISDNWFAVPTIIGTVCHELGHLDHWPEPGFKINVEFSPEEKARIAKFVSRYAAENYKEFYAEVFSGKMNGIRYNEWVNNLFDKIRTGKETPTVFAERFPNSQINFKPDRTFIPVTEFDRKRQAIAARIRTVLQ